MRNPLGIFLQGIETTKKLRDFHYELLMAFIEDLEDAALVCERANGSFVEVDLDEL